MFKPSRYDLDRNLEEIHKIEYIVKSVKSLTISLKCYHSLRSNFKPILNSLYNERLLLKQQYNEKLMVYNAWKLEQLKLENLQNEQAFNNVISKLSNSERELLKKFWHKV